MEGYFASGRDIKMVFQLIDMRHPATEFDISMLEYLSVNKIPYTVILTKADKLNKTETQERLSSIYNELGIYGKDIDIIPFSIQNSMGVDRVREILENSI